MIALKDEYVLFILSDNGCGMPEEVRKNLFKPFASFGKNGTGLGMSIALNIVEKNCGEISVESREVKGASFRILIPVS